MKLKYYLRGIAIGIIFTIIVMTLTGATGKEKMSDSEIIHAAKLLGMEEAADKVKITGIAPTPSQLPIQEPTMSPITTPTVTPTITGESTAQTTGTPTEMPIGAPTEMPTDAPTTTPIDAPTGTTETPTDAPIDTPTPTPIAAIATVTTTPIPTKTPESDDTTDDSAEIVILKVKKGMYSAAISQAAYEVGLVKDAKDFDKYLSNNGFASNIHIGDYKIKKGATYFEIASIITTK